MYWFFGGLLLVLAWSLSAQRLGLIIVSYLICGLALVLYENRKSPEWQIYSLRSPVSALVLLLLWPARFVVAIKEWTQRRRSSERYRAGWVGRGTGVKSESAYFGSWGDAVAWAQKKAQEHGSPSMITDDAKLRPSKYDQGRIRNVMYEVDSAGRIQRI